MKIVYRSKENVFIVPNHEKKADYYVNPYLLKLKDELQFRKWQKNQFFLSNQSIKIVYHNKKNVFMVPNHEKKVDYNVNPCLSQWKDELQF